MRIENIPSAKTAGSIGTSLAYKYTDDDGAEISVYAIERLKNEQIRSLKTDIGERKKYTYFVPDLTIGANSGFPQINKLFCSFPVC